MRKKRTQKERRHSGLVTPKIFQFGMRKSEIIDEALEPQMFWDDWQDYRDGFRGCADRKMISSLGNKLFSRFYRVWNKKQRLLLQRRFLKKGKLSLFL
jgi:hypothetical protein